MPLERVRRLVEARNPFSPSGSSSSSVPDSGSGEAQPAHRIVALEVAWSDVQVRTHVHRRPFAGHHSAPGPSRSAAALHDDAQGMDYLFPLHQDGRLVLEALRVVKRTFHTVRPPPLR